ncbi:hypothetical protein KAFR_0A03100 [Kazachstania africana CBS 2517]|uniref:PWWP domain-containing protein n=1 Tax=Kazachstania africana (strain ATCC 22294 / BCRC 22015 / CBS 2517 / CECT 1963 / NBRC 1671 / NRRL Y-8276) TaxID=1071382 RepID=H2AMZ5_KAZAF|nr:hypothetical protein KAFR_0A03100 [Kazachstania africana CBS 2517]CCF55745.1 hypothetical protein KAFR_0A03100 [Kazachstania africana CBS 2517]
MSPQFKTGDLVLCKVGSFPPWPAVIFPQRFLRKDVLRKRKPDCVAVCFFNDPTYYWEQPHRLKSLDDKIIVQFLEAKSSNQTDLIEAYKQAKNYKNDLKKLIVKRFVEEKRKGELDHINDLENNIIFGKNPFSDRKDDRKNAKDSAAYKQEDSSSSKNNESRRSSGTRKRTNIDQNNENYIEQTVNNIKSDKYKELDKKRKERKVRNKLDRSRRVEIAMLFRRRIQKNLIQRESKPTINEINESHKLLNKIVENLSNVPPFFDIDTLRKSKLHKLLKVIINDKNLDAFHPVCEEILLSWSDFLTQLKAEKEMGKLET